MGISRLEALRNKTVPRLSLRSLKGPKKGEKTVLFFTGGASKNMRRELDASSPCHRIAIIGPKAETRDEPDLCLHL